MGHDGTESSDKEPHHETPEQGMATGPPEQSDSLFEHLPFPALQYHFDDETVAITRVNPEFKRVFDTHPSENRSLEAVLGHGCETPEDVLAAVRNNERTQEYVDWSVGGDSRSFQYNLLPSVGVLLFEDITEWEREQRDLQDRAMRLESFASIVSHDLRNPLEVAQIRLEAAQDTDEEIHFEKALDALDRMKRIITDVRSLTIKDEEISTKDSVQLQDVAQAAWETVDTQSASLEIEDGPPLEADDDYLQQSLENLLRNAIEHGGDGVQITIRRTEDGFVVADDGSGIPPEEQDDVFEAGFTTADSGTGLGLSIVKRIANAHGWAVDVTTSDSGGACFRFFIH